MEYNKIIPIGYGCGISFVLKHLNLRKETSLFEWFVTKSLDDVTNLINMITNDISNVNISKIDMSSFNQIHRIYINGENMFSDHYDYNEYIKIFERRAKRFINDIQTHNGNILFVRNLDYNENISSDMVDNFNKSIHNINPNLNFKLLLVSNVLKKYKFNKITSDNVFHTYIAKKDIKCVYWFQKTPQINLWLDAFKQAGFVSHSLDDFNNDFLNVNDNDVKFWK